MRFRPYPGLTLFTVISLAILLWLGTWQYQRMGWKTDLLARIDAAAASPAFDSIDAVFEARAAGDPIDYRRINISGPYVRAGNTGQGPGLEFHVYKSKDGKTQWRIFRLLKTASGTGVFIAAELVSDGAKDIARPVSDAPLYISGYVRAYQKPSRFAAKSTPGANRWFSFNALRAETPWEKLSDPMQIEGGMYIDAAQISDAPADSPLPVKKPDLPNNHFDYMLTWYSFALILLVIYFMLHIRGGRLRLKQ